VVSTGSTDGCRGLDRLDRRVAVVSTGSTDGLPWSRQARPTARAGSTDG
jgi:hypothetical protein